MNEFIDALNNIFSSSDKNDAIEDVQSDKPDFTLQLQELSEEIESLGNVFQNIEKTTSTSSESVFKLKNPPDVAEILSTDESSIPPSSYNVGVINAACQNVLREMERQLLHVLKKNRKEQELIENYLNNLGDPNGDSSRKYSIKCAGIPYFKDMFGYPPPFNEDVISKKNNNKLLPIDIIDSTPLWTKRDATKLVKAVIDLYKDEPKEPDSMDWMKISVKGTRGKYSASECRSKWIMNLQPGINKSKWKLNEFKSLEKIAEEYKYQNWEEIAVKLGTNRTALQCCVKYHSTRVSNPGKWTKEEDELLKNLVFKFKVGDFIPWKKVAWYFESRSLRQCAERYIYHLDDIKKGFFTVEEDYALLHLVTKYKNFGDIARLLPNRTASQIRSRYEYLVKISMPKFTKNEDELLSKLMIQYPRDWKKISEHFETRSTVQCRGRWADIQKKVKIRIDSDDDDDDDDEDFAANKVDETISRVGDSEIVDKNLSAVLRCKVKQKQYSGMYKELIDYHSHCYKFLYGPKPLSCSEEVCKSMRVVMSALSISSLAPFDFDFDVLMSNCEFGESDIDLLKALQQTKSANEKKFEVSNKIIPPNFTTLIGIRSILLVWDNVRKMIKHYKAPEAVPSSSISPDNRLLFGDAQKLFKARMKSLFVYPIIMSDLSSEEINVEPVSKPKTRKTTKRISKLKRKKHAKFMSQTYREKLKKDLNEKLEMNSVGSSDARGDGEKVKKPGGRRKREDTQSDESNVSKKPRRNV